MPSSKVAKITKDATKQQNGRHDDAHDAHESAIVQMPQAEKRRIADDSDLDDDSTITAVPPRLKKRKLNPNQHLVSDASSLTIYSN